MFVILIYCCVLFCNVSAIAHAFRRKIIIQNFLYFVFLMATLRIWGDAPFPNQACLCVVMQGLRKQETQSPTCSILSSLGSAWTPSVLSDYSLINVSSLISTATDSSISFVITHDSKSHSLWSNNASIALYSVSDKFKETFFRGSDIINWKELQTLYLCTYSKDKRIRMYSKKIPRQTSQHVILEELTIWPVSYTHLTLPTICSV